MFSPVKQKQSYFCIRLNAFNSQKVSPLLESLNSINVALRPGLVFSSLADTQHLSFLTLQLYVSMCQTYCPSR